MKLSTNTIEILKNYSRINPNLVIKEGNVLKTTDVHKTISALSTVEEQFPEFIIYDLNKFLGILSLFNAPDIIFGENWATIKEGTQEIQYTKGEEEMVTHPREGNIVLPTVDVKFTLDNDKFNRLMRGLSVLQVEEVVLKSKDGRILLCGTDQKNSTSNIYSLDVGPTDQTFNIIYRFENFNFLKEDYNIEVCFAGITKFESGRVTYWVPHEHTSTHG